MKYRLLKDLPTFAEGDIFELRDGHLYWVKQDDDSRHWKNKVMAYHRQTLERFPSILNDWFEEIHGPKTVWDLEIGDEYWFIDEFTASGLGRDAWGNDEADYMRRDLGLAYISHDEGKRALARMKARVILEQDANEFDPNWISENENKWYVAYFKQSLLQPVATEVVQGAEIYFASREDAQRSIDRHRKEWLIYFGTEK